MSYVQSFATPDERETFIALADSIGEHDFQQRVVHRAPQFNQQRKAFWFVPVPSRYMERLRSCSEVADVYDVDSEIRAFNYEVHVPHSAQLLVTWFAHPKSPTRVLELSSAGPVQFSRTQNGKLRDVHDRTTSVYLPNNMWVTDAEYDATACAVWFSDAMAIAVCSTHTQAFAADPSLRNAIGLLSHVVHQQDKVDGIGLEVLRIPRHEIMSARPTVRGV